MADTNSPEQYYLLPIGVSPTLDEHGITKEVYDRMSDEQKERAVSLGRSYRSTEMYGLEYKGAREALPGISAQMRALANEVLTRATKAEPGLPLATF